MKYVLLKFKAVFLATIIILFLICCIQIKPSVASQIYTDKENYLPNEKIKVYYRGAPGNNSDWICISRKDTPDTVAGDYQYIPQGSTQGQMVFHAPTPGQYEVRAYYNYQSKGYVVSARHAFFVRGQSSESGSATPPENNGEINSGLGIGYAMSELSGSAKPAGGIQESIPVTKKFKASKSVLWNKVQDVLDEQGYFYNLDSSSGRIKTDPKVLGDQSHVAFLGATYSAVVAIKVAGSSVSFRARFNKQSNLVMGGALLEFPEKENELRKLFFEALTTKLRQ